MVFGKYAWDCLYSSIFENRIAAAGEQLRCGLSDCFFVFGLRLPAGGAAFFMPLLFFCASADALIAPF